MRLRGPDGVRCARARVLTGTGSAGPRSEYLRTLDSHVSEELLAAVDKVLDEASEHTVTEDAAMTKAEAAVRSGVGQEGACESESPPAIKLAELARLTRKSEDVAGEPMSQVSSACATCARLAAASHQI